MSHEHCCGCFSCRHLRADATISRHPKNPTNFVASWAVFSYLLFGTYSRDDSSAQIPVQSNESAKNWNRAQTSRSPTLTSGIFLFLFPPMLVPMIWGAVQARGLSALAPLNTRNHTEARNIIFSYETGTELCGHRCPDLITCQAVHLVFVCDPEVIQNIQTLITWLKCTASYKLKCRFPKVLWLLLENCTEQSECFRFCKPFFHVLILTCRKWSVCWIPRGQPSKYVSTCRANCHWTGPTCRHMKMDIQPQGIQHRSQKITLK